MHCLDFVDYSIGKSDYEVMENRNIFFVVVRNVLCKYCNSAIVISDWF